MEQMRRFYINKLRDDLRELESYKIQTINAISRFKSMPASDVTKTKLRTLAEESRNLDDKIESKRTELRDTEMGKKDAEIKDTSEKNRVIQEAKLKDSKRKKSQLAREKEDLLESTYKKLRSTYSNDRKETGTINYEYRKFKRKVDTIPGYLLNNLSNMPNNKGYIWKGIWLMGDLPEQEPRDILTMFERRGDLLIIRESDNYKVRIYHKYGRGRKTLVESYAFKKPLHEMMGRIKYL